jgi:hypothetical protein
MVSGCAHLCVCATATSVGCGVMDGHLRSHRRVVRRGGEQQYRRALGGARRRTEAVAWTTQHQLHRAKLVADDARGEGGRAD